jgi:MraZ protein
MLRGHATAKVDEKGRFKIPAEYLEFFLELCGSDRRTFITSRDGRAALVYPMRVWERHEARLAELPSTDPAVEAYLRTVSYWGREVAVDGQGRLRIHPLLRTHASLGDSVSIFGKQNILEICDHESFRDQPPVLDRDTLTRLSDYGI